MKITNVAIKRRVFTMMIYFAILVLGLVSLSKLALEFFPDLTFPTVVILTQNDGVGPQEMESSVTKIIESAVASTEGIENLTGVSKEGLSIVAAEFEWGEDLDAAVADLRSQLDLVRDMMPDGATSPTIFRINTSNIPVAVYGLKGNIPVHELYDIADQKIKDRVEQVDGIARLSIEGGRQRQVQVLLDRNRLDAYNMTPSDIINILRAENINASGGNIKKGYTQFTLRTQGEFENIEEIRNVVISFRRGEPIYLHYVAEVKWGVSEKVTSSVFNGQEAVRLVINKQSGANTVEVVERLKERLATIEKTLPRGVKLQEGFNTASFVTQSISSVANSGILGGILAVFVVFFFLRNVRASLIIGLAIPMSIIATFIIMYFSDVTLNIVSMGGLALGIGMLVDNAIVVLENTYAFLSKGQKRAEAARLGAQEIAMAIFSSTLTTVCVFLPFVFTSGMATQIFQEMALTVAFSLAASLFVSLTLVPMLSASFLKLPDERFLKKARPTTFRIMSMGERMLKYLDDKYKALLGHVLDHKKLLLTVVFGFFLFTMIFILRGVPFEFMPENDQGNLRITVELPPGTRLETTDKGMSQLTKICQQVIPEEDIKAMFFISGNPGGFGSIFNDLGPNLGRFRVRLIPKSERSASTTEYMERIQKLVKKAPAPLGAGDIQYTTQGGGPMGGGSPIDVIIRGHDLKTGNRLARKIKKLIEDPKQVPKTYNVEISRKTGVPELRVRVNRIKAASMGLNMATITSAVKQSVLGQTATYFREEGKELDIYVRLREEDRQTINDIENIQIVSPYTRKPVRIGNIARIVRDTGPVSIERDNQERVIHVTLNTSRGLQETVNDIRKTINNNVIMPAGFSIEYGGNYKDMQDTFADLGVAILVAILLVYAIMASIFESLLDPFIIFFTFPLSLVGVIWMLFATGTSLNVNSLIGVLVLAGVVVNNGIVLVDYINILRARGLDLREAIIEGGRRRLRPILMTTLTTVLAMTPLAIGLGEGSESSAPLARAVVGGLSVSTVLSLVVIPVLYMAFNIFSVRLHERRQERHERKRQLKLEKYGLAEE